jgi:hypothetical protein
MNMMLIHYVCKQYIIYIYKICERNYPVLVFGLSDKAGQFFPICCAIMSHETTEDFKKFYETLGLLCQELEVPVNVKYIMQDGCAASKNAAYSYFGENIQILMCYFHVIKNVKERLKSNEKKDDKFIDTIIKDIRYLHFTTNKFEYAIYEKKFFNKWISIGLASFKEYFNDQWCKKFHNWKIYNSPHGFASTNNPVELVHVDGIWLILTVSIFIVHLCYLIFNLSTNILFKGQEKVVAQQSIKKKRNLLELNCLMNQCYNSFTQ